VTFDAKRFRPLKRTLRAIILIVAKYRCIIEKADDGSYSAYVPSLPGCTSCGDTLAELQRNIRKAIALYIDSMRDYGEDVPPPSDDPS
jgi:predicted RNase H-like HicB family nuclease